MACATCWDFRVAARPWTMRHQTITLLCECDTTSPSIRALGRVLRILIYFAAIVSPSCADASTMTRRVGRMSLTATCDTLRSESEGEPMRVLSNAEADAEYVFEYGAPIEVASELVVDGCGKAVQVLMPWSDDEPSSCEPAECSCRSCLPTEF